MANPTSPKVAARAMPKARCGTSREGLPIGVQVVAGPWRDDVALAAAQRLEDELGGWRPPPP